MEEERRKNQPQQQQQSGGEMGTSENSNDLTNPVNSGGKAENSDNDTATAMTRNPTDRAGASVSTKTNITGSDFDGQVAR